MKRLAQPHLILFVIIFFFCNIANEQATIVELEKENIILDDLMLNKMRDTYREMFIKKKLSNQLLVEYYKYYNF
jgi:hypothetical protein